jgi:predicted ribosome quality control (RQC) complex YloA/Tae2 family protein
MNVCPHDAAQVGSKMSSLRLVQSGRAYAPPPLPPGIDPDACGTFEEWRETIVLAAQAVAGSPKASGTVVDGIVRGFRGSSPSLGRELCLAAAVEPLAAPADLSPQDWARLHEQWEIWLQRVESADFACSSSPCGAYSMLGAYPAAHASALLFLSTYYSRYQQGDDFERVRSSRMLPCRAHACE